MGRENHFLIDWDVNELKTWKRCFFNITMHRYNKARFRRFEMTCYRPTTDQRPIRVAQCHFVKGATYRQKNYMMKIVVSANHSELYVQQGFEFHHSLVLRGEQYVQFFLQTVFEC